MKNELPTPASASDPFSSTKTVFIVGGTLITSVFMIIALCVINTRLSNAPTTVNPVAPVEAPASSVKTPEMTPVEARYQEWKKDQESETIESKYDRMPQECKDAGATPAECKEAGELLERVNEGPTWSGAEFDYNRSLVK